MSILYDLTKKELWMEFLTYKISKEHLSKVQTEDMTKFIESEKYLPLAEKIINGGTLDCPVLKKLNKKHSNKKRLVFSFNQDENYILKMLAYLMDKYDYLFAKNLYSFRKNKSPKQAIKNITGKNKTENMFSYKLDIKDYFNSADTKIIINLLKKYLHDDIPLVNFIASVLDNPMCFFEDQKIKCKKGIMAGVPISGFLANLYLLEMDKWFEENHVLYCRYSDDIIVFGKSMEEIEAYKEKINLFLKKSKLCINTEKESLTAPKERWEFLGFSYCNGKTDISKVSLDKIKAKIKRKAKSLLRWKNAKCASDEQAIKAFIKFFNKKFYCNPIHNELTWCRWYFPVINTSDRLKEIDRYTVQCIRYIKTGKHSKSNYNLRYETIKSMGFAGLVNAYYKFRTGQNDRLDLF